MPEKYTGDNCAFAYLKDTPLLALEYIERSVSLSNRTSHTHILGASGSGKSNLIEYLISRDLTADDCCVVVIDSQVQMIPKLADVDIDVDDVTYITPSWNLALNLFDVGYADMKKAGIEGERLINTTVDLISFVLEGMMGAQLSDPQKTIFQYAIQLVITIPGGNIFTFFDLLADDGHLAYSDQIKQFDANTRAFFQQDFGSEEYKRSREAIRRRLQSMLRNPTFRRLFSATENKVDMYEELQDRKLILIDTNLPMLGKDASAFFGRLFIALIVQASHRRFGNRGHAYKPVYLYVDEAHEYFDEQNLRDSGAGAQGQHRPDHCPSKRIAGEKRGEEHHRSADGEHRHQDRRHRVQQGCGGDGGQHADNRQCHPGAAAIHLRPVLQGYRICAHSRGAEPIAASALTL